MIRTISDETVAASTASAAIRPLSAPDGSASVLPALTKATTGTVGLDITTTTGSISSRLLQGAVTPGSLWPLTAIDTFTEFTNDSAMIAQPQDFNALVSAVRALEAWTLRIARGAPGDLAMRLTASGERTL